MRVVCQLLLPSVCVAFFGSSVPKQVEAQSVPRGREALEVSGRGSSLSTAGVRTNSASITIGADTFLLDGFSLGSAMGAGFLSSGTGNSETSQAHFDGGARLGFGWIVGSWLIWPRVAWLYHWASLDSPFLGGEISGTAMSIYGDVALAHYWESQRIFVGVAPSYSRYFQADQQLFPDSGFGVSVTAGGFLP